MKIIIQILKENRVSTSVLLLLAIMPLIVSSTIGTLALVNESQVNNYHWGYWLGFALMTAFTMAFALTPTTFVAILSGYLIAWQAVFTVVPAYCLALVIGYFLAKWLDHGRFFQSLMKIKEAEEVIARLEAEQLKIIVLARLSPVLPFAVTSFVLSMAGARLRTFLLGGMMGMLPRTLLAIWVGIQTKEFFSSYKQEEEYLYFQVLTVVLIVISVWGLISVFGKALKKSPTRHHNIE
ncbi:VTT domain-containing protein [Rapidithrix thailandica]|uniref:TVP38/TMEM64 family membrane protein n=1 Tax=Rapidithrix thailandica TaxID=413964 RepID=A0AAW9S551_9BACT